MAERDSPVLNSLEREADPGACQLLRLPFGDCARRDRELLHERLRMKDCEGGVVWAWWSCTLGALS